MIIEGFIWLSDIVDKIESKHGVTVPEVENIFTNKPFLVELKKDILRARIFIVSWGKLILEEISRCFLSTKRQMRHL